MSTGRTATALVDHSSTLELERPETGGATREIVCGHPECRQRLRVHVLGVRETRARRRTLWRWAAVTGLASVVSWTLVALLLGHPPSVFFGLAGAALTATTLVLAFMAPGHLGVSRPDPVLTGPSGGTGRKGRHVIV
ncbi:hypothetical protein [Streptomyces sp. GSL17-111]|uniref:hypothetical protein n=1 Tax=Streptomyces sp. GSL17-111 TaxID=3121596 RepID=UPI0030F39132